MGYESKLIVIKKGSLGADADCNNKEWAEKIAEVRLCVIDNEVFSKIQNYPVTNSYYYEHGNLILEDAYGVELKEIPLSDCITILENYDLEKNKIIYVPPFEKVVKKNAKIIIGE